MNDFVKDPGPDVIVDLFGAPGTQPEPPKFGQTDTDPNIFSSVTDTTTQAVASSTTDTTTVAASSTTDTTTVAQSSDILGTDTGKGGRKPKYNFTDASGYFKDRMENGKFVRIEEEQADGTKKLFVPSTPEDFDEVIETQVNHRFEKGKKEIDKQWYQSKSPAWQAVAKYAEMVDDPAQIIPFIQGVKNIQTVANIDENTPEGAEQIIRARLEQRGDPKEVIDSQINALKATEKLVSAAQQYKPVILQEEQQALQRQMLQEQQRMIEWNTTVADIRDKAIKAIEQPLFGKEKLKQEEKAAVYELIAYPSEQEGGYPIYSAIDRLYDSRDFETLRQIALLLHNRESYTGYLGNSIANKTAGQLQRKLTVATDNRSTGNDEDFDDENTVTRGQFTKSPRFGR